MITKTIVLDEERLNFLPQYFGKHYLKFEMLVYHFMGHFTAEYNGGYWQFYTLDNGGTLMALDSEECFTICNTMNYFEGTLSAEATSIGVNLFAMNALMQAPVDDALIERYHALRDFAVQHKEGQAILGFID